MNKLQVLGLQLLLIISGAVCAQENEVKLLFDRAQDVDLLLYSNHSFIRQVGTENHLTVIQDQQGQINNAVELEQLNHGNTAYIEQTGSGHSTMLVQSGTDNEANLWSMGHLTMTHARQEGEGNFINSYVDNRKILPKAAVLIQNGSHNKIDLALLGNDGFWDDSWPRAAYISQTGNDLEVSAVFDSYESPVYIEQQSGPTGGGMKIEVSTSAFTFPMKR